MSDLDDYIKQIVDSWPPLTEEQKRELQLIFSVSRDNGPGI